MALGIQIAGALFGLFMIYYSFIIYKKKEFTAREICFWAFVWIIFIAVALFPNILDSVAKYGGFLRVLDLLVISGFIFLIAVIFYVYTIVRKNQKQLERLVREIAMKKR